MTKRCSSNVIQWASETFTNSTFVLYEQINPNDSFGLFMQNHFRTIGSALKCINAFPTMDSQLQRFKQLGWEQSEAMDMNQFYYNLVSEEERNRVEWLEPFDEYEEWHLKCAHYMVLCAYSKTCESLLSGFTKDISVSSNVIPSCVTVEALAEMTSILRFGHASTVVNGVIVTVAGFGEEYGKHQRLSSIVVTDAKTFKSKLLNLDVDLDQIEIVRLRHTLCSLKDGSTILIGGRMSPTYSCKQVVQLLLNCHDSTRKDKEGTETSLQTKDNSTNGIENSFCKSTDLTHAIVLNGASRKTETPDSNYELVNSKDKKLIQNKDESDNLNCAQKETLILNSDSRHSDKNCVNIENTNLTSSNETHSNKVIIDRQNSSDSQIKEKPKCLSDSLDLDSNKVNSNCDKNDFVILENMNCDNKETKDIKSVSLTCSVIKQTGYIPVPRWRHSAVVCQKAGKEMIFVYGGRNETRLALNCGYLFDPDNGQLSQVCNSESEPGYRQSHTASIWNNQVIIAGVLTFSSDLRFDVTGELLPRYSHTAQVIDNLLVLIGGVNLCHQSPGVAVINLLTGACAEYALSVPDPDFLVLLHQHQICYLGNGRFVVIGGGGNCFSFGTLLNRSPFILDINKCVQNFTQTVCNKNGLAS
ncbi:LCMT2 [Mytilus edulis]|uniref:PPM2 n=1 Tax=Mytilus edulis TaxID=6550 RepID=A0A8S3SR82_MYTED|nr:LCMT2 [Mytilus edulis]